MTTPIAAKRVIVVGSATTWPITCSRCERPKRVKSGMLSESVAQKPTIAVTLGTNTGKNAPSVGNLPGAATMLPTPVADLAARGAPPRRRAASVITSTYGAAQFSTLPEEIHAAIDDEDVEPPERRRSEPLGREVAAERRRAEERRPAGPEAPRRSGASACPPIQHWMPNQPHATSARMSAGTLAPKTPYAARAKTGKGMPYFVPGCELSEDRDEDDAVADQDGDERLPPAHPRLDEPRRPSCRSGCSGPSRSTARRTCRWSRCAARGASARGRR